jgi:myosin heavy subunit
MKQTGRPTLPKKTIHTPSKSQDERVFLLDSIEDIISTMASPTFKEFNPKTLTYSQTSETPHPDPKSLKPFPTQTYPKPANKERPIKVLKDFKIIESFPENSEKVFKEKEEIIKLQENFILNLKNEIEILEKEKILHEQEINQIKGLKSGALKLEKKILKITEAFKKDLRAAKLNLCDKDEVIQKIMFESSLKIKEKTGIIEKLKIKVAGFKEEKKELLRKLKEIEKFKLSFECLAKENKKLNDQVFELTDQATKSTDQLKILREENKILVKNYKEVQSEFLDLEKKYNSLRALNCKTTNAQMEITNLLGKFESINSQNHLLNEKVKIMSERILLLSSENSDLKEALLKFDNTSKRHHQSPISSSQENLKSKTLKFTKPNLSSLQSKSKASCDLIEVSDPGCSMVENQMSHLEFELGTIRSLNLKLLHKEEELNQKLSKTLKSKNFFQDQAIQLQSRVEELERMIVSQV